MILYVGIYKPKQNIVSFPKIQTKHSFFSKKLDFLKVIFLSENVIINSPSVPNEIE